MSYLFLSLFMLSTGPLLSELARYTRVLLSLLDGFVLVTVGTLVALDVLPHSVEEGGYWALLFAVIGLVLPYSIERLGERGEHTGHLILAIVVVFGLLPHSALDGIALATGDTASSGSSLKAAVVIHRIPVSFAVWWLIRPFGGIRLACAALCLMGLATTGGFLVGESIEGSLHGRASAWLDALVGASLLHVLLHRPHASEADSHGWRITECIGALIGLGLILFLPEAHMHPDHPSGDHSHSHGFAATFLELALQTAPALLLGYLVAGGLGVFLPKGSLPWLGRGNQLTQSFKGMLYGLPLPICSCGVVPVYRSLVTQKAAPAAAIAFLIATPELGIESIMISWPLLGPELAALRLICATVVALTVGWWVGRAIQPDRLNLPVAEPATDQQLSLFGKLKQMVHVGFGELVDETAPWIIVGLAAAAFLDGITIEWLNTVPDNLEVPLFALAGMPLYVCASGATPLAAVLIAKGVSPGAAIAFLLTGPATNITTYGVLSGLHGRATALRFIASVSTVTIGLGYLVNLIVPSAAGAGSHDHSHAEFGWLHRICLGILIPVVAWSLLRIGPRSFLGSLFQINSDNHHDHGSERHAPETESCCPH